MQLKRSDISLKDKPAMTFFVIIFTVTFPPCSSSSHKTL